MGQPEKVLIRGVRRCWKLVPSARDHRHASLCRIEFVGRSYYTSREWLITAGWEHGLWCGVATPPTRLCLCCLVNGCRACREDNEPRFMWLKLRYGALCQD